MTAKPFYAYMYLREDGTPYYAGKGYGKRAFNSPSHRIKPPKDKSRIIFEDCGTDEQLAFEFEKYVIALLGRKDNGTGILRNMTDGGEGASGHRHTEEHRRKISDRNRGRVVSIETRQKISESVKKATENKPNPFLGLKHSEETKEILRKVRSGKKHTAEVIARIKENTSKALKGLRKSDAHRRSMSIVRIGVSNWTPERRKKHSERMSGTNNPNFKHGQRAA